MTDLDGAVERVGRWTAARSTRRSFLARAGRLGVLVAGGSSMAMLLSAGERAEARVCGQSGVAPKCSTYDCDATWGWCWYASGCCADGALKKICDCCAPNTPNPVGYCPSGTRVLCIMESCGADPRLMTRPTSRLGATGAAEAALLAAAARYPRGTPMAVVGDAESAVFAAIAGSVGRVVDGPVLLTSRATLDGRVRAALDDLGVEFVKVVGPHLAPTIDAELVAAGVAVERIGTATGAEELSAQVAAWSRPLTGARGAVVVAPGAADRVLATAAGVANARRVPLLVGTGPAVHRALATPRPVRTTLVVGMADAEAARTFPGGIGVPVADQLTGAVAVAEAAVTRFGMAGAVVSLVPEGQDSMAAAMAGVPGPVLFHRPQSLDGVFDWLLDHRGALRGAYAAGTADVFGDPQLHDLQAVVNEFEAHLLTGVGGEGLPVIPQPHSERPIGRARR